MSSFSAQLAQSAGSHHKEWLDLSAPRRPSKPWSLGMDHVRRTRGQVMGYSSSVAS